eukprot:TRINITY_DN25606_c0_g1_i1.p3 TRINITY_DN25606_c0_g1~~TRINITY_DN25606_c0_g1_i1.p3  ORF type:complete len:124 (+),score=31.08 TRINITY_DN25606_c0_g1_i1:118-489(+)
MLRSLVGSEMCIRDRLTTAGNDRGSWMPRADTVNVNPLGVVNGIGLSMRITRVPMRTWVSSTTAKGVSTDPFLPTLTSLSIVTLIVAGHGNGDDGDVGDVADVGGGGGGRVGVRVLVLSLIHI